MLMKYPVSMIRWKYERHGVFTVFKLGFKSWYTEKQAIDSQNLKRSMCFVDVLHVVQHKNNEDLNLWMYNVENMSGYICCDNFGYADMDDNVVSSLYPLVAVFQTIETFLC